MTSVTGLWQTIEEEGRSEAGWHIRRFRTEASCELFAGVRQPDRMPGMLLELPVDDVPADLTFPRSAGFVVEPQRVPGKAHQIRFALSLADRHYRPIFGVLCDDTAGAAAAARSPRHALREWAGRLHAWQAFMARHGAEGLSETAALGLLGELLVLRDELVPRCGVAAALDMWSGPSGDPNDFTLHGGFLEVKTTSRQAPERLEITNADQLDSARGRILLAHVRLLLDAAGETLPAVVETIHGLVAREIPHRREEFAGRLMSVGYVPLHTERYVNAYRRERLDLFDVRDAFPRITRSELRRGVRSCSYAIELASCADFRVPAGTLDELTAGTAHA